MPRSLSFLEDDTPTRKGRQADPEPLQKSKKRTAHFDSDDEAEQKASKGVNGRAGLKNTHALKQARRAEADRLLPGREKLPVYEGEQSRLQERAVGL